MALFTTTAHASDIKVYEKPIRIAAQKAAHVTGVSNIAKHKTHESRKAKNVQGHNQRKSKKLVHGRKVSTIKVQGLNGDKDKVDKHKTKASKAERTKF